MDPAVAGVIVAAATAVIGWFLGRRSERISTSQYKLSASAFALDWFRDLRSWSAEAIDVLSEALYCAPGRDDSCEIDPKVCLRCRHRISALIDRGRFFLPNYNPDDVGQEKPAAYRGLRHPALDLLVAAEEVLSGTDSAGLAHYPSSRSALMHIKRAFVSEIQEILDPRAQNKTIAELVRAQTGDPADSRSALERLSQEQHPDL